MKELYRHPEHTNYACGLNGILFSLRKGTVINKKRLLAHRFVVECCKNQVLPKDIHVHHIDGDKGNNSMENLDALTATQHMRMHVPGRKTGAGSKRPLLRITILADGTKRKDWFPSTADAVLSTRGALAKKVHGVLNKEHMTHAGFGWEYAPDDIAEETWKDVGGLMVSDKGRVQHKHGRRTYGSMTAAGYRSTRFKLKNFQVHRLVATAFHGPPPNCQDVVDHIDRNSLNNAACNLRWASRQQNYKNSDYYDRVLNKL